MESIRRESERVSLSLWDHGHVWLFATSWTVAHQATVSVESSYWSVQWFPSTTKSSWPRDRTQVCCIADRSFTVWAIHNPREIHTSLVVKSTAEFNWPKRNTTNEKNKTKQKKNYNKWSRVMYPAQVNIKDKFPYIPKEFRKKLDSRIRTTTWWKRRKY